MMWSLWLDAKLFKFFVNDKVLYSITEKAKHMTKSISFRSGVASWLVSMVKACNTMVDTKKFLKTFLEENRIFLVQQWANSFGQFLYMDKGEDAVLWF